jgi:hypothetical protein
MEAAKKKLITLLNEQIANQWSKGRIMSSTDVAYYLDHELEVYEDEHGDIITEDEFNTFADSIITDLCEKGTIYLAGSVESYCENVRAPGLISVQEAHMKKEIRRFKDGKVEYRPIFRDTEFPYDEDTGNYILE